MRRLYRLALASFSACAVPAWADTLYVDDGSRISGRILTLDVDQVIVETSFAGTLAVPVTRLEGVTAEGTRMVALASGDRVNARPVYDPEAGVQMLLDSAFGDLTLETERIAGLWPAGGEPPEQVASRRAHAKQLARVEQSHAAEVRELEQQVAAYDEAWTARVGGGAAGARGNTENFSVHGRAEANRDVGRDRQVLYVEGALQEQNGTQTQKEVLAGLSIEHDVYDRWFLFASEDLEFDEFENLDLRSVTQGGIGYWAIREPDHHFKPRVGLGYEFEAFMDGTRSSQGVLGLGYDYMLKQGDAYEVSHQITVFPSFTDPGNDFRVNSRANLEFPLASDRWSLVFGVRNQYNNQPPAGNEQLDTTYTADVVYEIE